MSLIKVAEKRFDFGFAHVFGVGGCAVKPDIANDPVAIGLFGAIGVMVISHHLADLVHEPEVGVGLEFGRFFHDTH